jgi:hypothetical protein
MKRTILLLLVSLFSVIGFAQKGKQAALPKLIFKEGDMNSVKAVEKLTLRMQFSQVDYALVDPSTRFTTYYLTENVIKVHQNGSADFATSIDSFTTKIYVGEVRDENEYFRFDSKNEYDIQNRLKDIRAIPRAQFLGQTLKYTVSADGRILSFQNLNSFRDLAIARAFEPDITQAMLSLSDSLRVGQLLEHGGLVLHGSSVTPYTITEIHVDRVLKVVHSGKKIEFTGQLINSPAKLEYLEGIAFPMDITDFKGGTKGVAMYDNGYISQSEVFDSASMIIKIDAETILNSIQRSYKVERKPLATIKGGVINYREIESHKSEYKPPVQEPDDLEININVDTGESTVITRNPADSAGITPKK